MLNKNLISKILFTVIILLFVSSTGFSQESLKEKLKKIKGDVNKITITSGGEEFTFQGEEAEKLFDRLKSKTGIGHSFFVKSMDGKDSEEFVIKLEKDSGIYEFKDGTDDDIVWFYDDDDDLTWLTTDDMDGKTKKIKIEMEDGKKKVTVTTKENSEVKTKVYEGKEADEYLEKIKDENNDFDIEFKDGKMKKKIIIERKDSNDN